ncbi:MAG: hypothetical protein ACRECH_18165, partial [Nitrososphaerales archaeon]
MTFYYSKGQISEITDTVGRMITFSYNGAGQVSSVSSGGITWSYSYSGSNLVSVSDPMGRVTNYSYSTGINSWLLNKITYPTGGMTTYTYGRANIGTEDYTYYVTLEDVYSSSTFMTESTQFNYTVINGAVTLCNTTTSDSRVIQSYDIYNFNNPSVSAHTLENGTKSVVRTYDESYDSLGRLIGTKTYLGSSVLLSSTSSSYDNWGNVIYSVDPNGKQTWFSYSNTDTSGKFVGGIPPTCSSCFYTNNSISSNIHDLLLGQLSLQNGTGGGGIYWVPITLTNSQSSDVSSGTQVKINVDWSTYSSYLASNIQNIAFFDSNWDPIYAWCESSCGSSSTSSSVWLKLDQTIPASGSTTVYLSIYGTSTNNLNGTGYWGEYPTATSTYSQYDNGANVFN